MSRDRTGGVPSEQFENVQVWSMDSPQTDRLTDMTENITLPQTTYAASTNVPLSEKSNQVFIRGDLH